MGEWGRKYPNAYGYFHGGGGWYFWFDFDQRQVQFLYRVEKHLLKKRKRHLTLGRVGGSVICMLTDAYVVCGWVGLKNKNAYVCLRWIWVSGVGNIQMLTDTFTVVEDGIFGLSLTKDK